MALKDWKKVPAGWKKNNLVINIGKKYSKNTLIGYNIDLYNFNDISKTLKTVKTKTQALAYAKTYMRKH